MVGIRKLDFTNTINHKILDPKYEDEVSGCTASVGIISSKKIFVVCILSAKERNVLMAIGQRWRLKERSGGKGSGETPLV